MESRATYGRAPDAPARAAAAVAAELWRFPVKSMQGSRLTAYGVVERGVVGDRAYAVRDLETGAAVSAKAVRRFPDILQCAATFVDEPRAGRKPPPVAVTLADGTVVRSDDARCDALLSAFFGRAVALTCDAADGLGAAAFEQVLGLPGTLAGGAFQDMFPVSVMSRATQASLQAARPESAFDVRRFRMNLVVETPDAGYPEHAWPGRSLAAASGLRLRVMVHDARCVETTLPQGDLPKDPAILRTVARENTHSVGSIGRQPCAGVYATVDAPGELRVGEALWLES